MSSPPTPEELEDKLNEIIGGRLGAVDYHRIVQLLSTQRKKLLDEVEAAGPGDRSNKHELGDFTPDQIEDIEKTAIAAIFEAQGFNQANRLWHAAIEALKEREL